jgi:hypothetical protein
MKTHGNVRKVLLFQIVSILFGLLLPLLASEILLRFLPVHEGCYLEPVNEVNPIWRFKPNRTFTHSSGWNFSIVNEVHSNNYGFINDVDYDENLASPLIAVIGGHCLMPNIKILKTVFNSEILDAIEHSNDLKIQRVAQQNPREILLQSVSELTDDPERYKRAG